MDSTGSKILVLALSQNNQLQNSPVPTASPSSTSPSTDSESGNQNLLRQVQIAYSVVDFSDSSDNFENQEFESLNLRSDLENVGLDFNC